MIMYENATIFTDDIKTREIIIKEYDDKQYYFPYLERNKLHIRNREGETLKFLIETSSLYKSKIMISYSFESNQHELLYEVEIKEGSFKFIDIKINYYCEYSKEFRNYVESQHQHLIINRLEEFYREVDTLSFTACGKYEYDLNVDKKISVELKIGDYEIQAYKVGHIIEITNFKYHKN